MCEDPLEVVPGVKNWPLCYACCGQHGLKTAIHLGRLPGMPGRLREFVATVDSLSAVLILPPDLEPPRRVELSK